MVLQNHNWNILDRAKAFVHIYDEELRVELNIASDVPQEEVALYIQIQLAEEFTGCDVRWPEWDEQMRSLDDLPLQGYLESLKEVDKAMKDLDLD